MRVTLLEDQRLETTEDLFSMLPDIHTRDPEQMRHAMLSVYGAQAFDTAPTGEFEARARLLRTGGIDLGFCAYSSRAIASFRECDFARVQIATHGGATTRLGNQTVAVDPTRLCVSTPGRSSSIAFEPGLEQLFLRVRTSALNAALAALLGAKPARPIEFDPAVAADHARAVAMRQLAMFVTQQLSPGTPTPPALQLRELQSYVAVSFLMSFRNTYSTQLEQDGPADAAYHVRLVEDYVEAHYDEPITVEKLAELTQVSVRSLFLSFQRSRGYTPKAFVKTVRLRKAREQMIDLKAETVAAIALRCGFQNLGHFARDYRDMFGEAPSHTLARARRGLRA